ncbi:molecular chaperone [Pseudomonas chlororaphis]|uniref:Molecular chaperone n=1 Tax=Pseudomonas chlororaphis TaxID=587753 RepID=A0A1Q8EV58_9PSED|nr:fimbria/pilus periplasmic chaperone [Pseudomonas chlororaphis]OLF55643.1 molecular chaperone [Pseudomonas chlororaphis]
MTPKAHAVYSFVLGVMFLGVCSGAAQASIIIEGTRLVYPGDAREVTVKINNAGASPVLAQSWLDDGDASKNPEEIKVPFLLSPAVIRLDKNSSAAIRITYTGEELARDRESLFWLNVLETPPRKEADENVLQFTFRTRIKVFFRPGNLSSGADRAPNQLEWKLDETAKGVTGTHAAIKVTNPTAFYISFGKVEVATDKQRIAVNDAMVAPFSSETFPLPANAPRIDRKSSVHYEVINDFGGRRVLEKPLSL